MKLIANLGPLDRQATEAYGIPGAVVMEAAGEAVARCVLAHAGAYIRTGALEGLRVVVLCGRGNNGGDGFVCARKLQQARVGGVSVFAVTKHLQGDAATALDSLEPLPVAWLDDLPALEAALSQADIVVDALLGSGLSRPVTGPEAAALDAVGRHRASGFAVIAVDLPSGLDGATGRVWGQALPADVTITFAVPKPGLYIGEGRRYSGRIEVADIGLPPRLVAQDPSRCFLLDTPQAAQLLPARDPLGHKFTFGNVLVLAGSRRMPGAAILTASSALKAGAGLVTLAAPESVFSRAALPPEIIHGPLPETPTGQLDAASIKNTLDFAPFDAIAIGPGLGGGESPVALMRHLLDTLAHYPGTVVLDADGLNALAALREQGVNTRLNPRWILTPHPGEFVRLTGTDKATLQADPLQAAREGQALFGGTLVLKFATTIITLAEGSQWVNTSGNSGMATAGSGDVLTGILAGLAHQAGDPGQTARLGVHLHGLAGDAAAERLTPYCVTASEIAQSLPQAFKTLITLKTSGTP